MYTVYRLVGAGNFLFQFYLLVWSCGLKTRQKFWKQTQFMQVRFSENFGLDTLFFFYKNV